VYCYPFETGLITREKIKKSDDWSCCGKRGCMHMPGPIDARVLCKNSTAMQ
jgi:hypothetical protein